MKLVLVELFHHPERAFCFVHPDDAVSRLQLLALALLVPLVDVSLVTRLADHQILPMSCNANLNAQARVWIVLRWVDLDTMVLRCLLLPLINLFFTPSPDDEMTPAMIDVLFLRT